MKSLFLTGYGLSVSVKNTRLVFKQGMNDPFSKERETLELPVTACPFDKVVIQGRGVIMSTARRTIANKYSSHLLSIYQTWRS